MMTSRAVATHGLILEYPQSQVVATKYEVLVEHRFAEQARALLSQQPSR